MTLRRFLTAIALPLTLLTGGVVCLADTTGQITGTVSDSSGAAVPGVEVKATQPDTGLSKIATTDVKGNYSLLALQTGGYNLTFSRDGFKTLQKGRHRDRRELSATDRRFARSGLGCFVGRGAGERGERGDGEYPAWRRDWEHGH